MRFQAAITVMPRPEIDQPQGRAVRQKLCGLGFGEVEEVRIGKRLEITLEAEDGQQARDRVAEMCRQLLVGRANENFSLEVTELPILTESQNTFSEAAP
jgi:phosphoribosylformylglycinamidine synthase subunit PurS